MINRNIGLKKLTKYIKKNNKSQFYNKHEFLKIRLLIYYNSLIHAH